MQLVGLTSTNWIRSSRHGPDSNRRWRVCSSQRCLLRHRAVIGNRAPLIWPNRRCVVAKLRGTYGTRTRPDVFDKHAASPAASRPELSSSNATAVPARAHASILFPIAEQPRDIVPVRPPSSPLTLYRLGVGIASVCPRCSSRRDRRQCSETHRPESNRRR